MNRDSLRKLILLWLGWAIAILAFQQIAVQRLAPARPDNVLSWVANETQPGGWTGRDYLLDPVLNEQVSWDSEFYISIATAGYDDPGLRAMPEDFAWGGNQNFCEANPAEDCYSLNYAFFPLYPWLMRIVAAPLGLSSLSAVGAATAAGVIVSLLGALGGMLGLYSLARPWLDEEGGIRAAFYLLIFPSGFFLAQVYSEGLFIGLTFGALALTMERRWGWAALVAAAAVWARPGGALLLLPMAVVWWQDRSWQKDRRTLALHSLAALAPAISYGLWSLTPLAERFHLVEGKFFGRGLLALGQSLAAWKGAFSLLGGENLQTQVYYALEFGAIMLAIFACIAVIRRYPALSLYGLALVAFAMTTGAVQGMLRYVLGVPAIFLAWSSAGRQPVVDRLWSLVSTLLLALLAMLFAFDFWVA